MLRLTNKTGSGEVWSPSLEANSTDRLCPCCWNLLAQEQLQVWTMPPKRVVWYHEVVLHKGEGKQPGGATTKISLLRLAQKPRLFSC